MGCNGRGELASRSADIFLSPEIAHLLPAGEFERAEIDCDIRRAFVQIEQTGGLGAVG